jgi:hypothetical protein
MEAFGTGFLATLGVAAAVLLCFILYKLPWRKIAKVGLAIVALGVGGLVAWVNFDKARTALTDWQPVSTKAVPSTSITRWSTDPIVRPAPSSASSIAVSAPDGSVVTFSAVTSNATINSVMERHFGPGAIKLPVGQYEWTGDRLQRTR